MLKKINFKLLGKAIWETMKYPLLTLGLGFLMCLYVILLVYLFGSGGVVLLIPTALLVFAGFAIQSKYQKLMKQYRKEQDQLVDILKR